MNEVAGAKKEGFIYEWCLVGADWFSSWELEKTKEGAEIVIMGIDDVVNYMNNASIQ